MSQRLRLLKILVLLFGAALLAVGAGCAPLYLLLPFLYRGPDLLVTNLTVASLAALTLSLGLALVYQARNSLRGVPSGIFRRPSPRRIAVLFVCCLILGQLMLLAGGPSALTALAFPPFHILAAVSPAVAILAYVGRRTRAASWRTVSLEASHGAVLAPLAGLAAELVVVLAVVMVISVFVAMTPGGAERLMELFRNLQDPAWIEAPENLAQLILSPPALVGIVLVFVIFAPLVEEFLKGLGVLLLGYRLRGEAEALVWGVACGAGFALAESLFNGSIALEGWGVVIIMRWGASLMHCVSSGVLGLGWFQALTARRWRRLLGAYGASFGIHALWNAAAVAVVVPSLMLVSKPADMETQAFAGLIMVGALAFLLLLTISMGIALIRLTKRVPQPPSGEEPIEKEPVSAGDPM